MESIEKKAIQNLHRLRQTRLIRPSHFLLLFSPPSLSLLFPRVLSRVILCIRVLVTDKKKSEWTPHMYGLPSDTYERERREGSRRSEVLWWRHRRDKFVRRWDCFVCATLIKRVIVKWRFMRITEEQRLWSIWHTQLMWQVQRRT